MHPFRAMSRRHAVSLVAILSMSLLACESGAWCKTDSNDRVVQMTSDEVLGKTPTAAPSASATASATATSTVAAPTATGTGTPQPARLRGALGVDHPPFAQNYGVGGASVGLACLSGIPSGGMVTVTLTGGTGAPPTVIGTGGADGSAIIPFPIQQFGAMNGSITSLRVNGQPANFQADPFSYTVGSSDLICAPPR